MHSLSLATLFATLSVLLVACDSGVPTCQGHQYSEQCQRELATRAANGDWGAARSLGLFRMNDLDLDDKTTLALLEQWTANDPGGLAALAELLRRSCNRTHRVDAVARQKQFIASEIFKGLDRYSQASHLEILEFMESHIDTTAPDCSNLD